MIIENFKTVQLGFEFCIRNYFAFTTSKSTISGTGQLVCYSGTFLLIRSTLVYSSITHLHVFYLYFLPYGPTLILCLLQLSYYLCPSALPLKPPCHLTPRSTSCFHCSSNNILKSSIQPCRNMSHVRGHTLFHTVRQ